MNWEEIEAINDELRCGLTLIKMHITEADTHQNRDLHEAVQRIVTAARRAGFLQEHGADANGYPSNWPRCLGCGAPALDGHVTCGKATCNEGGHR